MEKIISSRRSRRLNEELTGPRFAGGAPRAVLLGSIIIALGLLMAGCHPRVVSEEPARIPAKVVTLAKKPDLRDDADKDSLNRAVNASIRYWQGQSPERQLAACGKSYRAADFLASLQKFQELLNTIPREALPAAVAKNFELCQIKSGQGQGDILVTGYYQPRFKASRVREPPFVYPVYQSPPDLIHAQVFGTGESQMVGRLEAGRLVPYWTRAEIETSGRLRGHELCYLADPVEVFVLQVQGSGLVEFGDGSVQQLLFAGTNGRPYRSIGRLLADEGRIPLAEIDMPRIRRYLHEHLDEVERILHYNERYVFFRLSGQGAGNGPVGSMGQVLTPGRSVALDQGCFPVGGLYFLKTRRPAESVGSAPGWQPMTRFVLHQDTGAAIKGTGRLDFFWGSGEYPERAAGLMKEPGELYLLMKR
jgi:membrane-bound lytic murein transglycosylase A